MTELSASWWISVIASALLGGIIAQLIAGAVRWTTKPRLRFHFGSKTPFVISAPRDDSPSGSATWIRLRVDNRGWRNAESCRVYLTDITRQDVKESIVTEDAFPLWSSAGGDGGGPYAPLSISRKFGRFWDVGFIPVCELKVASDEFWIRTRAALPPGTYAFRIAAAGTNFNPITTEINIQFQDASAPIIVSPATQKRLRFRRRRGG
jgi:hypothetical protein